MPTTVVDPAAVYMGYVGSAQEVHVGPSLNLVDPTPLSISSGLVVPAINPVPCPPSPPSSNVDVVVGVEDDGAPNNDGIWAGNDMLVGNLLVVASSIEHVAPLNDGDNPCLVNSLASPIASYSAVGVSGSLYGNLHLVVNDDVYPLGNLVSDAPIGSPNELSDVPINNVISDVPLVNVPIELISSVDLNAQVMGKCLDQIDWLDFSSSS
ncbi:hypothetical protein IEQ34_011122 [Dendrobium chrysotoxum]|uniref:Uncharacterized protein n=1 Tax=Dendrobium chrysotoxum TaxID=161865 RepID=A0AAV7GYA2_DENCH|nr:hypothetical protein IEQ34_011122 [Dendrobium chrysotoxum]